jgi:hypothetical protein
VAPRLTPHVRHREKYVDVPVSSNRAFVFEVGGLPPHKVRTLRQFVSVLEHVSPPHLDGYVGRGDFSRWIGDVFGDHALAAELRALEQRYRAGSRDQTIADMAGAVRGRYDLTDEELESSAAVDGTARASAGSA